MDPGSSTGLYPGLLGSAWEDLDERLRRFHSGEGGGEGAGLFTIRRGRALLARVIAGLLRFPREGQAVPTCLVVRAESDPGVAREVWERSFGGRKLVSRQYAGRDGLLAERFGCLEFRLRLRAADGALHFQPAGSALALGPLRVRLPGWASPAVEARVSAAEGGGERLAVQVKVTAPLAGTLLQYQGCLERKEARP